MLIFTTNLLAAPILLAIWVLDVYLGIIALRWFLASVASNLDVARALARVTDPFPDMLRRAIARWLDRPLRPWVPWLFVAAGCWILRNSLLRLVLMVQ